MVKHIVMWSFQETLDDKQKKEAAVRIKEGLERLTGIVPGLISVKVVTDALPASTHEIGLFCELESQEALDGYQVHPEHQKKGLGGKLMAAIEEYAAQPRFELFTPKVSAHNIRFYNNLGYRAFGEKRHECGVDFVLMEKAKI